MISIQESIYSREGKLILPANKESSDVASQNKLNAKQELSKMWCVIEANL